MDVDISNITRLSQEYGIPELDLVLIGLNLNGVDIGLGKDKILRGRFSLKPNDLLKTVFFAATLTENTPYKMKHRVVSLNGKEIGKVGFFEEDTCDETYFRKGGKAITLNSNSRSGCTGCQFCGTYSLEQRDYEDLTTEANLSKKVEDLLLQEKLQDLSHIENIGVVTGCFENEDATVEHLLMVRKTFEKYEFNGELQYIGSQVTSEEGLRELADSGPFGLYLTVECFERRKDLMKPTKAAVTLAKGRQVLKSAKDKGMGTSFLYILGLDNLNTLADEFQKYVGVLTRHPIVNLMQSYNPCQNKLRNPEAHSLEYYVRAKQLLEGIFLPTGLRPRLWENYRSPWVTQYYNEKIE